MQPRVRATLVIAAIAIASGIAGAAIDRSLLVHSPRHGWGGPGGGGPAQESRRRTGMLDRLSRDLTLTPAQRVAIDSVFQRTDSTLRAIRMEAQPRVQAVLEQSRLDIASRLDATQRDVYAKLNAERDRRRRAERP
jgi:hypothetical protein